MLLVIVGATLPPVVALIVFGNAVVAASFLLAWAAETAQLDISGGLAIALLAVVVMLPEYAVDLFYAFAAGSDPALLPYVGANMTGSNRLLLGLGWPLVALLALTVATRRHAGRATALELDDGNRLELGFLAVAALVVLVVPATGELQLGMSVALLAWFALYAWRLSRGAVGAPELIGTAAALGALARPVRRRVVAALFVVAAVVVLISAEPFATSLVQVGAQVGLEGFLVVQWLAPLASEAPELIVAVLLACRGKGVAAIVMLISSQIYQWTLLLGSLPLAHLVGGGGPSIVLDARQNVELLLASSQTLLGVALLLTLRFPRWAAWSLLGLYLLQFPLTEPGQRLVLAGVHLVGAAVLLVVHRQHLGAVLVAVGRSDRASG